MRDVSDDMKAAKNELEQREPWLILYELWIQDDGSERYCFLFHDEAVEWEGRRYNPFPIKRGRSSESSEGELQQWSITVANIDPSLAPLMEEERGFIGRRVRMILLHKDFLDDPGAPIIETAFVEAAAFDEQWINLSLGYGKTLKKKIVRRRFNGRCDFRFKDPATCAYAGALTSCDHSLTGENGCVAHGIDSALHPRRFGGFPSIPRGG